MEELIGKQCKAIGTCGVANNEEVFGSLKTTESGYEIYSRKYHFAPCLVDKNTIERLPIKDSVINIVLDVIDLNPTFEVTDSTTLSKLDYDSIDLIEMAMNIEDEFDIDVDESEFKNDMTIKEIINIVNNS